jgi:hypothetical protein
MEIKNQDEKLKETNKSIAVSIKMLQDQLSQGIKISKLQHELTKKVKHFEISHLKCIPLRKSDFQRDFKIIDTHMNNIQGLYDKLDLTCKDWKQSFKKHNMENYTFIARNDTIPMNPEPFYVDPSGFVDMAPPNESNNCYDPFPVPVNRPRECKKCQFVGHTRRCPSPEKKIRENWNDVFIRETQDSDHPYLSVPSEGCYSEPARKFVMQSKPDSHTRTSKAHPVAHGDMYNQFNTAYHQSARDRSEQIFNETWNKKEEIRAARTRNNVPYSRIERAFMATAISATAEEKIEKDEIKAKLAAAELRFELKDIDVNEVLKEQQLQIDSLLKDLEEFKKGPQSSLASIASHHSIPINEPPTLINTAVQSSALVPETPAHGEISYTMQAMLDKYETLDDDSKNELLKYAISTGNENLQSRLLMLCQNKNAQSHAKLTKELIKLAESYKVPDLKFDKQASKQRFNYQAWIRKIQPILAMFSQMATVLPNDKIVPFSDPHAIGNRALYLLNSSRTDSYFQRAIKQFEPFGDKALELLQEQCAHISREDQSDFHQHLVRLKIRDNESASSFIKRFTYAKTTAEAAPNTYSNNQLMDFVLAGLRSSKQDVYRTVLQLYRLERLQGTDFKLREIEQNFFQIDEGIGCDKRQLRTEHTMVAGGTYRGILRGGRFGHRGRGRGRGSVGGHP